MRRDSTWEKGMPSNWLTGTCRWEIRKAAWKKMKFELCPKTLVFFTKVKLRKNVRSSMFNGSKN